MIQTTTPAKSMPPLLTLLGTEEDLGAALVRLARTAAAVHMAEAARGAAEPGADKPGPRAGDKEGGA